MTLPANEFESILAVDIGSVNTRAVLFDVAGITYRMLAAGSSPSTHLAPIKDAQEGVAAAVHQLEEITGRNLLDAERRLITPSSFVGSGVDRLVLTSSAGSDVRIVAIGLLEELSLASVEKLAGGVYSRIVERYTLNDDRKPEDQLNAFIQSEPDMVIMAGGTNRGAGRAVLRMVEQLRLELQACQPEKRPSVIFAGNEALADRVKETLEKFSTVQIAPNIRPFASNEDIVPAEEIVSQAASKIRSQNLIGFTELEKISGTPIIPTASAEARMVRFQSLKTEPSRTVLGVNVGSAASHLSASSNGKMDNSIFRGLGVGQAAAETLNRVGLDAILRWLPVDISGSNVRDYLWQKSLFPAGIPMDVETLAIEQAVARAILSEMKRVCRNSQFHVMSEFEPILASGAVISQAPTPQQTLLILLDGIQPGGIATILSDRFGVLASLGASAMINPEMVIQVLESGVITNLGSVISPIFKAKDGEVVLKIRLTEENASEQEYEFCQGEIARLPLGMGKTAKIQLKPQKNMEAFPGFNRFSSGFKVIGGELGVIVDTRGRPVRIPSDPVLRCERNTKWINSLQEYLT
jgi:hypothetical protein